MTSLRALALLLLLAACSESSFTSSGTLRVTAVSPLTVSGRGGAIVTVNGTGFDDQTQITVRGVRAAIVSVTPDELTFRMPRMSAGTAPLRAARDGDEAIAANPLKVEAIALAFAEAPPWQLPQVSAVPRAIVPFDSDGDGIEELLVASDAGVAMLSMEKDALVAKPILLAPQGTEPAVRAAAVDRIAATAALCTGDAAAPIRLIQKGSAIDGGIDEPRSCTRAVYVRVTAGAPAWLVAQTSAGLAAWRPEDGKLVPRTAPMPALGGEISALIAADFDGDGDEELVVAGRSDGTPWLKRVVLSVSGDADEVSAPFPAPRAVANGLAALDATGDGHLDLFTAGPGQDALFVGDGHGQFFDDTWRLLPFERAEGRAVAAEDLDLDGKTDLVIATNDGPDRLFVAGDGAFVDRTPLLGLAGPFGAQAVALVDLDRDGDLDVVTATATGLHVRLLVEAP